MKVLGKEIPRASKEVIEYLLKLGILYIGDDGQLHVVENK